jgi:hypothetical protein
MRSPNEKVNKFLKDIHTTFPDKSKTVEEIRKIFFDENSEIEEDIKYGGIIFNVSDQLVGGIYLYNQHISIEFSNGAEFNDKNGLLEGKGKMRRHLKVLEENDIKNKNTAFYINQAVNL